MPGIGWAKKATRGAEKCTNLGVGPGHSGAGNVSPLHMSMMSPIRFVVLLAGLPLCAVGQSTLPANEPTSLAIGTAGPVSSGTTGNRANVEYVGGLLRVSANNSSLNAILREIGRQTGMKITGGVAEDRVFGTYGPAPASTVITSLLDGMKTNVVILGNAADGPAELILSPQQGGATPPNPNAMADEQVTEGRFPAQNRPPRGEAIPPQQFAHPPGPGGTPNGLPPSNGGQTGTPINGGADLGTTPGAFTGYGQDQPDARAQPGSVVVPVNTDNPVQDTSSTTPASTSTDSSQPQSPNGVSTPQQIFEQLQKLRQQQTSGSTTQ